MFKKIISLLLCMCLIFSLTITLCSCKKDSSDEYPVTIGDITIEKEPMNIVVLSDDLADIISYIGYDVKMVGRSIETDQQFLSVVPIVGTASEPNVDSILSYEADLVIADSTLSQEAKDKFAENNIIVVTMKTPTTLDELKTTYTNLGMILGGNVTGKAAGEEGYTELFDTLDTFKSAVPNDIIKTACYLYFDENDQLCTLTKGSLEYTLFGYCGATNVFSAQEKPQVDLGELKISTPSYIIYDDPAVLTYLKEDPELSTMTALEKENVYNLKKSEFARMGTSLEDNIYHMIEFMFILTQATPDEATPDDATAAQTEPETQPDTSAGFVE